MIPNDNLINLIHSDKFNVPLYSNYQKFRALTRSDVNQIEWSYEYDMLLEIALYMNFYQLNNKILDKTGIPRKLIKLQ